MVVLPPPPLLPQIRALRQLQILEMAAVAVAEHTRLTAQ
jgi:hypothetical protein